MIAPRPAPVASLLERVTVLAAQGDTQRLVTRITHDSRTVTPGTLFVAYRGVNLDVHRYLPDAAARGASACLVERPLSELAAQGLLTPGPVYLCVDNARAARAQAAAALWGHPSEALIVVGVTGTDGKTTTCTLLEGMLAAAGRRPGLVTTVTARIAGAEADTGLHVTTPEPEELQRYLAQMVASGCDTAIVETTSHGLAQHRVDAVAFDVAVFTNITREALDYHQTFEAYLTAKSRLFEMLTETPAKPGQIRTAVLNADDPAYQRLAAIPVPRIITYGIDEPADFRAERVSSDPAGGIVVAAQTPAGPAQWRSPLVGAFNAANLLAAAAAAHALGCPPESWTAGAAAVSGVPGRMEIVNTNGEFTAIVDFAHTPNGLRAALEASRELAGSGGRVVAVFGCAGLRDPGKREPMGRTAGELADVIVLTSEDPRTEDPARIAAQIRRGVMAAGPRDPESLTVLPDRMEAIRRAVELARPGDVVLVCGKGHERSMCFGDVEYPWDDRSALRAALSGEAYGALPTAPGSC